MKKRSDLCLDMTTQANHDNAKVAIYPTVEGNTRTLPSPLRTREPAHSTESSRRDRSGTYNDDEDFGDSERSRAPKFSHIKTTD